MKYVILLILLFNFSIKAENDNLLRIDDHSGHAKHYSKIAGLIGLTSGGANELRVWSEHANIENSTLGIILTSKTIQLHTNKNGTDLTKPTLKVNSIEQNVFTDTLKQLQLENGKFSSCGVKDGTSYVLEGVYKGKYFSLASGSPTHCKDKLSILINKTLSFVQSSI